MKIRRARPNDAADLSQLAERSFRDAFASVNSREDLDSFCQQTYGESIQLGEILDPGRVTLVADTGETFAGFAQVRMNAAKDCVPDGSAAELCRIYLDQCWLGQGVANQLMDAAIETARSTDAGWIWLGVWEHNTRAIAFYHRYGFRERGEHTFHLGSDAQRDLILARPLADDGQRA